MAARSTGTLSKSFASCGGFVAGPTDVIDALRVSARTLIFTAGSTPGALGAASAAIQVAQEESWRRERVLSASTVLRKELKRDGIAVVPGASQILGIKIGDPFEAIAAARDLFEEDVNVGVAVHPAVPKNGALLRVCVNAGHTDRDLEKCASALSSVWKKEWEA